MESTASLISPSSPVSASTFSFSPLHSPRQQHFHMSPSPTVSNSTSPIPSPRRAPSFADNLDLSSSSSSMWNTPRPCVPLQPPPEFAFSKSSARPPAETSAYTTTTTTDNTRTRHASSSSSSETRKPRRPAPDNHYSTLGVSRHATSKEIRSAYRKLALQYHPDVSPLHQLDTSTKVFAEINEAYSTLSDPQKRQLYDLKLALESPIIEPSPAMAYSYPMSSSSSSPLSYSSPTSSPTSNSSSAASSPMWASSPASSPTAAASSSSATMWTQYGPAVRSPREYTHAATGRVYPSMNSFYREWRRGAHAS